MTLRNEVKDSKVDTIKWMVGIFLALALMIIGLYFKEIEQYFKTKLRHYSEFLLLTFELKYKSSFYTRGKRTN